MLTVQEVLKYEQMAQDLTFGRAAVASTGLFSVACDALNRELLRRAQGLVQRLIARMQQDAQVCADRARGILVVSIVVLCAVSFGLQLTARRSTPACVHSSKTSSPRRRRCRRTRSS